ncbi:hypothetical protein GCM10010420_36750 [Streptomyces glaucosporus]|uniref:Uncharacterized protein n=1 Tax=Streptomyces glaucosporus TaxID=284044 RepID=A0ABN3IK00_9ACTN
MAWPVFAGMGIRALALSGMRPSEVVEQDRQGAVATDPQRRSVVPFLKMLSVRDGDGSRSRMLRWGRGMNLCGVARNGESGTAARGGDARRQGTVLFRGPVEEEAAGEDGQACFGQSVRYRSGDPALIGDLGVDVHRVRGAELLVDLGDQAYGVPDVHGGCGGQADCPEL